MAKWVSLIVKLGALVFILFVPTQFAIQLAQRLPPLRFGLGRGEIGDRLCLGQVKLAIFKGAAGEFTGFSQAQAKPPERRHNRGQDGTAAMQMQLGDVLAGEAGRRRKPQHQRLVEGLTTLGIDEPPAAGRARRRQGSREGPDGRA